MSNLYLGDLFLDTELADIIFEVENEEVLGHRLVFAKACDYFKKLLCGHFKESDSKRIVITGTSAQLFKEVKRFIYLNDLQISDWRIEDSLGLLSLAHEYQLELLFCEVEKAIEAQPLNFDSWKLVHSAATVYESDALNKKCISFAEEILDVFIQRKNLKNFTSEFVCFMFDCPKVSTCNQHELLGAICKWKKNRSTAEIMSVFQKICWESVSPTMNQIIMKELFSVVKNVDNFKFWNDVDTGIIKSSEYIARLENMLLTMYGRVELDLPKYQCSICCRLHSDFIQLWFQKNGSGFKIPIKKLKWQSSSDYIIRRAYGSTVNSRKIEMIVSKRTVNNSCYKYSATFAHPTSVYFINIYSDNFKGISKIRLQNLVIS